MIEKADPRICRFSISGRDETRRAIISRKKLSISSTVIVNVQSSSCLFSCDPFIARDRFHVSCQPKRRACDSGEKKQRRDSCLSAAPRYTFGTWNETSVRNEIDVCMYIFVLCDEKKRNESAADTIESVNKYVGFGGRGKRREDNLQSGM